MSAESPDNWSEQELSDRLRQAHPQAVPEAVRRYRPPLLRYIGSYLRDPGRSEEVVQEVLGKLTDGSAAIEGAVRPWLYRVAHNRCLDILRRQQRSPTYNRPLRTGFDAPRQSTGAGTRVAREERRQLIRQIVDEMPEDYRSVLVLKYFEGFSREDIATTLGLTEAAVKGRLVRASQHLEEQLRKYTWAQP
jgi:RNA polymerase sigma-70 factor (ECF subfamily)